MRKLSQIAPEYYLSNVRYADLLKKNILSKSKWQTVNFIIFPKSSSIDTKKQKYTKANNHEFIQQTLEIYWFLQK